MQRVTVKIVHTFQPRRRSWHAYGVWVNSVYEANYFAGNFRPWNIRHTSFVSEANDWLVIRHRWRHARHLAIDTVYQTAGKEPKEAHANQLFRSWNHRRLSPVNNPIQVEWSCCACDMLPPASVSVTATADSYGLLAVTVQHPVSFVTALHAWASTVLRRQQLLIIG